MADETGRESPLGPPHPASFTGPKPSMATHWPTPPGGWPTAPPTMISGFTGPFGTLPPPPPRGPKHLPLVLSIVAGVVVLACLAGAVTITVFTARTYRRDHRQASASMNEPVRDGSFQFTADSMRCGVQAIGAPDEEQSPIGQFCVVTLTIKNVGSSPATFADSIQKAYGVGGVWFSSDPTAGLYANPDPTVFLNQINPGNSVKAVVVYDIPRSSRIMRLEVHENPSTPGAVIKIS
jgi:hypothetical protein